MKKLKDFDIKYVSNWVSPYKNGKAVFSYKEFSRHAGVYLIKVRKKVRYVGKSKVNLYKTMYRHFEQWTPSGNWGNVTYKNVLPYVKVKVFVLPHRFVDVLESYFLNLYKPQDNYYSYELTKDEINTVKNEIQRTREQPPF